ncbi:trypsin-like [Anopheles darlingi]|uniref:trypsin-like n=1 Tax=Anopheles darlingi TaxID=43151 RepID=UPI0021004E99|nr:trypsin-like [Anopheles darlingi]
MHVSTPRRISQKNPQHTGNAGNVQEPEIALEDRSIRSHPEEDLGDEHYDEDPTDERYEENPSSELLGNNRDRSTSISLALAFSNNAAIKCTANIVSPRWALTSYTCIKGKTKNEGEMKWKLIAGPIEHSASKEQLTTPHIEDGLQIVDIKRVVSQFMYTDDAVLLELATPLKLNDIIGSVCLTETSSTINPKEWCVTTGWESDLKDKSKSIQYMKNVTAVNVRTGRCDSYNEELPNNIICVESLNSNQNICYSDEGAPLMCYVNSTGQWQLEGFLSNHGNCDNRPAIYNSITPTIATWIRNTVGNGRMFEHTIINK